jgi:integrase
MPRAAPNKRKLTTLLLQRLRPQARAFMVWDAQQHGLALRVWPSGRRSWYLVYRRHGRPRWYHIGAADAVGLADARKLAAETMLDVIRGRDPAAEKRAARSAGTFAELAERYREEYARKKNKSWQQADYLVRRYLLPAWGKLSAESITRGDVRAVIGKIAGPILANKVRAAASAVFSWAVKQELIETNPCRGVEANATRSRERVLSDGELPLFWSAFDDTGLVRSAALRVLLLTGQRPGEVCHMRREHVSDGWWTMPGAPCLEMGWPGTKNSLTHRVWLPQAARDVMAELGSDHETTGFVFSNDGRRPIKELDGAMREVCRRFGIGDKVTPHDLRRMHGSTITAPGFGRDAMNRIQNHRQGGIADVYDRHEYAAENKRVMETVAGRIMSLVEGETDKVVVPIRR